MIKEIRRILQSGQCLSDFSDKCKNDGACGKCEDEALEKLIAEHDAQIIAEAIDEYVKLFIENALIDESKTWTEYARKVAEKLKGAE